MEVIGSFDGQYRWMSNFGPGRVTLGDITYPTREHGYQACKTLDRGARLAIAGLATPGEAKRAGRRLVLRPDWRQARKKVMLLVELSAFTQNPDLGGLLIATGDALLVEGNHWHDNFWGDCRCPRCADTPGLNWLGRILGMTRDIIAPD